MLLPQLEEFLFPRRKAGALRAKLIYCACSGRHGSFRRLLLPCGQSSSFSEQTRKHWK